MSDGENRGRGVRAARRARWAVLALCAAGAGCEEIRAADAGADAAAESGVDVAQDVGAEASAPVDVFDARADEPREDVSVDASVDVALDAPLDAPADVPATDSFEVGADVAPIDVVVAADTFVPPDVAPPDVTVADVQAPDVACPAGQTRCGEACVDTQSSAVHCGACGVVCPAGQSCVTGMCRCPSGTMQCGTQCVNVATDRANCGACGVMCPAGQGCVGGACSLSCGALTTCGSGASMECRDLQSSVTNCGSCGNACAAVAGGSSVCEVARCRVLCGAGRGDCNGTYADGCEVDTGTSNANCGACGNACAAGRVCTSGACACGSGTTMCGAACVNTQSDGANCGSCGNACTGGRSCSAGSCVCPSGQTFCGGACVNTQNTLAHCGACNNACGSGQSCVGGVCVCPSGQTLCGGACVNTQTDVNNCGACGYRVVSAGRMGESAQRTCVAGRPSPAWVPVTSVGAPSGGPTDYPNVRAWTGRRLLVSYMQRNPAPAYLYEPASNTWSMAPFTLPYSGAGSAKSPLSMPNRDAVFLWSGESSTRARTGLVIRDTGSSVSLAMTAPLPAGLNDRYWVSNTYDGTNVHVVFGDGATRDDGGIYNVETDSWTRVAESTLGAPCFLWHGRTPTAYARGAVHAFGGYRIDMNDFCRTAEVFSYDVTGGAWLGGAALPTGNYRLQHLWLAVGERVLLMGGLDRDNTNLNDAWLFDPQNRTSAGWASVPLPPAPSPMSASPFSVYTGRSVIVYGGSYRAGGYASGGSLGVVSTSGISWALLPTSGAPSPRDASLGDTAGQSQSLWTGREAIFWGGSNPQPTLRDGARYQPPVGCACPINADAPSWLPHPCAGVPTSGLPACVP